MRSSESQLYGVGPHNPVVWSIAAGTLIVVALLGTLVPSLLAAHLNPIEALRTE